MAPSGAPGARLVPAMALALLLGAPLGDAGAQELRYSLTPAANRVLWDNALGLEDSYLYGGRLAFTFGGHVGLHGYYLTKSRVGTRLGDTPLTGPDGAPLGEQQMDVTSYGANLLFTLGTLGTGVVSPFVQAGGGVLQLEPERGSRAKQIMLSYGGGVRIGRPGGVRLQLQAEDWLFRLNRFARAPRDPAAPLPGDAGSDDLRHNLAFGAGLVVPFGGSAMFDDRPEAGLGTLSLPVELMVGRLDFADEAAIDRQTVVGARTGVNFGPYVGLRGYYWRGMSSGFQRTEPLQSWGGEAQFNLNTGPGLSPYLLAGAGQLDFRGGFRDAEGRERDDRTMLIVGGGLALGLTDQVRLNLSARNYLFGDNQLGDVASTSELRSNWMLGAGLSFRIGGATPARRPAPAVRTVVRTDTVYVDSAAGSVMHERPTAKAADSAARDSAARDSARASGGGSGFVTGRTVAIPVPAEGELYVRYGPQRDAVLVESPSPDEAAAPRRAGPARVVPALPAARGALSPAEVREAVRAVVRDELERERLMLERERQMLERERQPGPAAAAPAQPPSARQQPARQQPARQDDIAALEQRLVERVDQLVAGAVRAERDSLRAMIREELARQRGAAEDQRRLLEQIDRTVSERVREELARQAARAPAPVQPVVVVDGDTARRVTVATADPAVPTWELRQWLGYSGATLGDGTQLVLGARANLGPFAAGVPAIDFVPEVAFGLGHGATTTLVAANAHYRFGGLSVGGGSVLRPYVGLGLGLLNLSDELGGRSGFDLTLNPAYGVSAALPALRGFAGSSELFVEHQGIAFFDMNRILVGLQWRR